MALVASLVAISPQLDGFNLDISKRHKLAFDVLSDSGNQFATQLGLTFKLPDDLRQVYAKFGIDLNKYNGDESWALPIPARLVIDQHGTVRSVDADPDYTVRPEPAETVRVLQTLKG